MVFYQTSTWISHRYTWNPWLLNLNLWQNPLQKKKKKKNLLSIPKREEIYIYAPQFKPPWVGEHLLLVGGRLPSQRGTSQGLSRGLNFLGSGERRSDCRAFSRLSTASWPSCHPWEGLGWGTSMYPESEPPSARWNSKLLPELAVCNLHCEMMQC